jgi:hypothetical protein
MLADAVEVDVIGDEDSRSCDGPAFLLDEMMVAWTNVVSFGPSHSISAR